MSKWCKTCGRKKNKNHTCELATLESGRITPAALIDENGRVQGERVRNRHVKRDFFSLAQMLKGKR